MIHLLKTRAITKGSDIALADPGNPSLPLRERMHGLRRHWRRSRLDRFLSAMVYIVALAIFTSILTIGAAWPQTAGEQPGGVCDADFGTDPSRRVLLIAADTTGPGAPHALALQTAIGSYFGIGVDLIGTDGYRAGRLDDATSLVVLGNGAFGDPAALVAALEDARAMQRPIAWIGTGAEQFEGALGLAFQRPGDAPVLGDQDTWLHYNGVPIAANGFPVAPPLWPGTTSRMATLATMTHAGANEVPAILTDGNFVYVGFLPAAGYNSNLAFAATIDALSNILGRRVPDPRVLLRLEDIDGLTYGPEDRLFAQTAEYLMSEGVFMHLAIIPETADADQNRLADIGDAHSVVELVRTHPDAFEIIQHGLRHQRADRRNADCYVGSCFEFFLDDDRVLGPETAAALAEDRMRAGQDILARTVGPAAIFEAPHYVMSPSQAAVADRLYPVVFPLAYHGGVEASYSSPWYSKRDGTVYGPATAGYVAFDDPDSVDGILVTLEHAARVLPDPVILVMFHPFMIGVEGREEDLKRLVEGARGLGYRFVSLCDEIAPRNAR